MNRFFPLRSNSDEGPLLEVLVCDSGVGISVVVVVVLVVLVVGGTRVVSTKSSSSSNTCVSERLIQLVSHYSHPDSLMLLC